MSFNHKTDWFYEGNISLELIENFISSKYKVIKDNSLNVRHRGVDIIVENEDFLYVIEVKGYPSIYHTKGQNKGTIKVTKPKHQAKKWLYEVIMTSISNFKTYQSNKKLRLGIGLPDNLEYRDLLKTINVFFISYSIDLYVFLIDENGAVSTVNLKHLIVN